MRGAMFQTRVRCDACSQVLQAGNQPANPHEHLHLVMSRCEAGADQVPTVISFFDCAACGTRWRQERRERQDRGSQPRWFRLK